MKYRTNFAHVFADSLDPPRFKRQVRVEVALEFPFPKNTDFPLLAMKALDPEAYANKKLDQFEGYTGIRADRFETDFNARMRILIDANFVAFIKKNAKPNFDAAEWEKVLQEFERKQENFVAASFSEILAGLVRVTYDKLEKIRARLPARDEVRVLSAEEAFVLWTGRNPVKFTRVEDKFFVDHMRQAISHQEAFDGAVARYRKKATIRTSSWISASENKILDLANNAKVYPTLHSSGQQVAVLISIPSTKVILEVHENVAGQKKEAELHKNFHYLEKIRDGLWVSARFLSFHQSFYVIGQWEPDSGKALLFHFQEDKPTIGLASKYRRWVYSFAQGKYTGPDHR